MKFEETMKRKVSMGNDSGVPVMNREKSLLLNKLATQKKIQENFDRREYRLVTGSDDGYIFFWNIPYDMVAEARQ